MTRYKLIIEYLGTNYFGWQYQDNLPTIQGAINQAIYQLTKEKTEVYGAGRTDTGVHALGQVAHFDTSKEYPDYVIKNALNHFLFHNNNQDIVIMDVEKMDDTFHARFSAKQRSYVYKIINRIERLTIYNNLAWQVGNNLNTELMNEAANYLVCHRDYSCFQASSCQRTSAEITIDNAYCRVIEEDIIEFHISARSFLHHMVRNIVGTLKFVGEGKIAMSDFKKIIDSKDRANAGPTAPSHGLYFKKVIY